MIVIPESVAFYWSEASNRAAVNVLTTDGAVPPDLSLEEVEQFELAVLAARRVRVDFWRLLRQIWTATWNAAVEAELSSARLLNFGGHSDYTHEESVVPSVDNAWTKRATYGVFDLPSGNQLVTCIQLKERDQELELWFYVVDSDGDTSATDGLDLGADWEDDGEGRRTTRAGALKLIGAGGTVDAEAIVSFSRMAIATLAGKPSIQ
ncbi:hypothetical protein H9Q09_21000 [Aurantimonas sp. DM33-3]|uniref:hypothetical protein n=1 Tax=Aurantimonas sp. DM33-3 TaxID=2766955 RepID=UPI0016524919|nr:hypothetical protein [Aurantimonas sp. DM33-3]MBC6718665.1 hypothetical protein [Aurantimonas sp. DM33-3]